MDILHLRKYKKVTFCYDDLSLLLPMKALSTAGIGKVFSHLSKENHYA